MWGLRWHFTNKSITGAPLKVTVTVCHTAEHYGEEYDDWNSAVLRSRQNCSNDGVERTDDVMWLNAALLYRGYPACAVPPRGLVEYRRGAHLPYLGCESEVWDAWPVWSQYLPWAKVIQWVAAAMWPFAVTTAQVEYHPLCSHHHYPWTNPKPPIWL